MRLTPSWGRSLSDSSSEESVEDADSTSGMAIYHTGGNQDIDSTSGVTIHHHSENDDSKGTAEASDRVDEFLPDSNASLLTILEEMHTPTTVDEITDQLISPDQPPIETWAAVHEQLHRDRLQALDATDDIEFDETQGVVEHSASESTHRNLRSLAVLGTIPIVLLFVLVAIVSMSVLSAVLVSLLTTIFSVKLVP